MASEIGKIVHCKICGAPIEARGNRLYCPVCYNQNRRNAAQRSNARTKMEREQTKREEAKMKENNRIATSAAELNMRAKLSNLGGISYVSCAANGKTAEFISAHFHKGDPIMLVGVLTSNQYQNKDGQNRTSYTLWVEKASFASRKNASQNGAVPAANAAPAQAAPAAAPAVPAASAVAQPSYGNYTGDDFADIDEDDLPF